MRNAVDLRINNIKAQDLESYSIDSDLLYSASAFDLKLSNVKSPVVAGMPCKLYIDDSLELNGQIDKVQASSSKTSSELSVSGRDLMGVITDASCELSDCIALENISVVSVARRFVKKLPFIQRHNIVIQKGCEKYAVPHGLLQVDPGMKIFDVLSRYASMRGLIFYSLPNGIMLFGKPLSRPDPTVPKLSLVRRINGDSNNIVEGKYTTDLSKSASEVQVVSQSDGDMDTDGCGATATCKNPNYPAGQRKLAVVTQNGDQDSPAALAKLTVNKMIRDAMQLEYTVSGHSQNGNLWRINTFVSVVDEDPKFNIRGDYLVYGRTFTKNKTDGTRTVLRLGLPGLS